MYLAVVARTLSALALCFGSYCWERPPSFQPGALAKQRQECRRTGTIVLSLFFQSCPHLVRSHNNAVSYPFYFCLYSSGRLVLPRGFLFPSPPHLNRFVLLAGDLSSIARRMATASSVRHFFTTVPLCMPLSNRF